MHSKQVVSLTDVRLLLYWIENMTEDIWMLIAHTIYWASVLKYKNIIVSQHGCYIKLHVNTYLANTWKMFILASLLLFSCTYPAVTVTTSFHFSYIIRLHSKPLHILFPFLPLFNDSFKTRSWTKCALYMVNCIFMAH